MGNTEKILQLLIILSLSQRLFAVDINTATVSELANELSGIGAIKAQRIVEYREKIGGFVYPEQLMEIYGIGPKLLERNLDKIEISQPEAPNSSQPVSRKKPLIKDEQTVFRDTQKEKLPPAQNTLQSQTPLPASKEASLPKENKKVPDNKTNNTNLDLSPEIEKPARPVHNRLWDILIVVPLFILCLFIFILAWLKQGIKDKPVQRKHWITTTFVCSGCGQTEEFENEYEGHFRVKHIEAILPPGWLCVPNWQNQLCDYCVECSKTFNR